MMCSGSIQSGPGDFCVLRVNGIYDLLAKRRDSHQEARVQEVKVLLLDNLFEMQSHKNC